MVVAPDADPLSWLPSARCVFIDMLMPRVRITELLHEVARDTGFLDSFTNLRTHERHDNENALLAAVLADGSNLGLSRMAEASQGVTPDQLVWTKSAYIRPETYKVALGRIINAHHVLPIAAVWGQGTSSSSDGQFFRSGKRGSGAGDFNARYGVDPGFSFYTHVSDQHGPYHVTAISAATMRRPTFWMDCSTTAPGLRSIPITLILVERPTTCSPCAICTVILFKPSSAAERL
jgi:hypothetical protein